MDGIKTIRLIEQAMDLMTQLRTEIMKEESAEGSEAAQPIHTMEDIEAVKQKLQMKKGK